MSSFPKEKPPFSVKVLDQWIRQKAGGNDEQKNRVRRGISYMVVSAVLGELRETDGTPLFILKGGVAMQLRFGIRARLSQDYDAAFRRELKHLEDVLADAPNHPVGEFIVRAIGKPEPLGPTGAGAAAAPRQVVAKEWILTDLAGVDVSLRVEAVCTGYDVLVVAWVPIIQRTRRRARLAA